MHTYFSTPLPETLDEPLAELVQAGHGLPLAFPWIDSLEIHVIHAVVFKHRLEMEEVQEVFQISRLWGPRSFRKLAEIEHHGDSVQVCAL